MKTLIIMGAVLVLLAGTTVLVMHNSNNTAPSIEIVSNQTSSTTDKVRFISPHTNEVVEVAFSGNTAVLNGEGYQNLTLTQTESASGARYESTAENVSIWNKGAEVTMYRGRQVIFVGQTEESMGNPNPAQSDETQASSTASVGLSGPTWVWKSSTLTDGSTLTPNKPGVFTLTFTADGTLQGATDCNGFGGSYSLNDSSLSSGPFAMTKMFCEGSQEMEFVALVTGETTVDVDDTSSTLTITSSAGVSQFTKQ